MTKNFNRNKKIYDINNLLKPLIKNNNCTQFTEQNTSKLGILFNVDFNLNIYYLF